MINAKKQKDEVTKRRNSRRQPVGSELIQWHKDAELIKARMKRLQKGVWSKRMTPKGTTTVQSSVGSVSFS